MKQVNVHEAKTHLSRLIEAAANGEPFVIAKAGKPVVRVAAIDPPKSAQRIGFLEGRFEIPDDFDTMGDAEIAKQFGFDP